MARRMVAADDQLVSFSSDFPVLVSTEQEQAAVWIRRMTFDDVGSPAPYVPLQDVAAQQTDVEVLVPTPDPGAVTQVRLFASGTGGPTGEGQVIDELIVARLDRAHRKTYLTDCSEGAPQLETATGGTFVRALAASGSTETIGQLFLGGAEPSWPVGVPFPGFPPDSFLLSAISAGPDVIHDIPVVDRRGAGATTNPRLTYGMRLWFVALVWDSDGGWDFTWTTKAPMPRQGGAHLPAVQLLTTLDRKVDFHVSALVCLDDSDDASYGEATFTLTGRPSDGSGDQTSTVVWDPMASSSQKVLAETLTFRGAAAGDPSLSVSAVEDDSGSFPSDSDDTADSNAFTLVFPQGPAVEAFTEVATLDAGPGDDDFRFQVHCSADVSYVG